MKNISKLPNAALRLRIRLKKPKGVGEALSPYLPVGWSTAYAREGAPTKYASGGFARRETELPANQDTIFRVASISKVFGAAAALRLVARGKLTLDGDITEVLGFSLQRKITLRQLLTHTAALDDTRIYDAVIGTPDAPTLDSVLRESFFPYEPGTRFHYSNLGAGVAGMLVEASCGMLFDDFVRQEFFIPYGIDASFHPQRIVNKDRMANCYRVPGRTLTYDAQAIARAPYDLTPSPLTHYAVPAGKLMICASDLCCAFARFSVQDKAMFVRQDHIGSVLCDAGRGLGVAVCPPGVLTRDDRVFWGHQGAAYGALCEAWTDLQGTVAIVLTNGVRTGSIGPLQKAGQSGIAALLDLP